MALVTLFEGPIDSLTVDPNATGKTFSADCSDGWSSPGSQQLSTPVHQSKRTGELIGVVLDAIGWPTDKRDVDPGNTVVAWWWAEGVDASTAINDLTHSEGPPAVWWVQGGRFHYHDRLHRITDSRSTVSQGTYTHVIPAGTSGGGDLKILKGTFSYDHGLNDITNSVTLTVTPRTPGPLDHVWRDEDPITLGANEARQIIVQADQPFINAQTPTAFRYDADGNPISGDYHLGAGTLASISLSRTSGAACILTITAGAGGAWLDQGMSLTAAPLTERAAVQVTASDPSSVGTFGWQNWQGAAPWANPYDAQAIADRVVSTFATARPSVTLSIAGVDDAHLAQIAYRTVGDRITVRNDEMGLNADFIVERVRHTISQLQPALHTLELGCQVPEPSQPSNVFTFDVAGKGFDQGRFGLNGLTDPATMFTFDVAGKGFDQGTFAS